MFSLRYEFRVETQEAYGGYCSYARQNEKTPMPYHLFSDYYSKGLKVKEIYREFHNEN